MITHSVYYSSHYEGRWITRGLSLDLAKSKVEELVRNHLCCFDEGEGRTVRKSEVSTQIPYRVTIETRTAEAGRCLDQFSVILDNSDVVLEDVR